MEKIKKSLIIIGIISAAVVGIVEVVAACIVHFRSPGVVSEISADGMLQYIAEGISSISTFVLAIVAIMQTKKANDLSEHLMDLEENRYKLEIRPFVMISDWKVYRKDVFQIYMDETSLSIQVADVQETKKVLLCIELFFQNTTGSFEQLTYWDCKLKKENITNVKSRISMVNQNNPGLQLQPGESKSIVFYAEEEFWKEQVGKWMTMELGFENRFAERYKETIDIMIAVLKPNDFGTESDKWHFVLFTQNYRIGKFGSQNGDD